MCVCVGVGVRERERETWLTRKRFERFHKYIISGIKCTKANNIVGKKKKSGMENKQMDRQTHREAGRQKYRQRKRGNDKSTLRDQTDRQ